MFDTTYSIRLYLSRRPIVVMFVLAAVANLLSWGWIFFQITPSSEPIFLSYNILFGVDGIGPWWNLLYMPLLGAAVLCINTLFGWRAFQKDAMFSYVLLSAALAVQLAIFAATWTLVFLNV